jgi:murein DD-endopeptidase MepM/ murein hydrolase activator NlpD
VKDLLTSAEPRWEAWRWSLFLTGLVMALITAPRFLYSGTLAEFIPSLEADETATLPHEALPPPGFAAPLSPCYSDSTARELAAVWRNSFIPPRTTFAQLMQQNGLTAQQVHNVTETTRDIFNLNRIRSGQRCHMGFDAHGIFTAWKYAVDDETTLVLTWGGGSPEARIEKHPFEWAPMSFSAPIENSLYETLAPADAELAVKVAEAFAWEVDFYHDLRQGDSVQVVYEAAYCGGAMRRTGRILAARLILSGKPEEAYLFEGSAGQGYYDASGKSLKRQFLKMPLKYGRFTSGFTSHRFHPVHKTYRPHYGVDYAAPTGTPVFATADGNVVKAARGRGEGNFVHLRHANGYETMYLHLSRFARGVRSGKRVSQGQVIGYVGSTGASTGPHVDYRMKHRGRWVNPRKTQMPPAPPIPQSERQHFLSMQALLAGALNAAASSEAGMPRQADLCPSHPASVRLAAMPSSGGTGL